MVNSQTLLYIDYALRSATGMNIPFGGKLVILVGDVFQLEPVEGCYVF